MLLSLESICDIMQLVIANLLTGGIELNKKLTIEKGTVQETLLIPLYGRKICNDAFPALYSDPYANELIESLDYDFSAMEKQSKSLDKKNGLWYSIVG